LVSNQQCVMKVKLGVEGGVKAVCIPSGNLIFLKILSKIRTVSTRKMMSYARIG
jgi:hypothetical protein